MVQLLGQDMQLRQCDSRGNYRCRKNRSQSPRNAGELLIALRIVRFTIEFLQEEMRGGPEVSRFHQVGITVTKPCGLEPLNGRNGFTERWLGRSLGPQGRNGLHRIANDMGVIHCERSIAMANPAVQAWISASVARVKGCSHGSAPTNPLS